MKRKIRDYIKQFFLIDDTPHKVAGGAALGIFLGIVPGEGILATLFLAYIFRLNRLAALAGVLSVNMWTLFFVIPIAATIGGIIFQIDPGSLSESFHHSASLGWGYLFSWSMFCEIALPLLVGFVAFAGAVAAAVYFGLFYFICRHRKHCEREHLLLK